MNNKYKIKYIKYKRKYNNLKIKQKLIGGLPDLLIGTLSALPITSTLSIYSLINTNENYDYIFNLSALSHALDKTRKLKMLYLK